MWAHCGQMQIVSKIFILRVCGGKKHGCKHFKAVRIYLSFRFQEIKKYWANHFAWAAPTYWCCKHNICELEAEKCNVKREILCGIDCNKLLSKSTRVEFSRLKCLVFFYKFIGADDFCFLITLYSENCCFQSKFYPFT